uniref:U-box domain-containing protein n=1 Tax=Tetradesmus obliquus TaxID=3088 RepID=A0A383VX39_TETOB|eukprot:jgi/Sobl393_1/19768/SZX70045.1
MQANIRITCIYLALCHVLLTATSPAYKHELQRLVGACSSRLADLSFGHIQVESGPAWRQQLSSGLWRSTELLSSVQQHMRFNHSTGSFTADGLVAYVSATDAIKGQGWKARATLFLQLMAPRYTMLPNAHDSLKQQMRLLALAAADLPAVGRIASAEDTSVGYRLTCTSPALQLGLGPQPYANCSVWPAAPATKPTDAAAPAVKLAAQLAAVAAEAKAAADAKAAVPADSAPARTCAACLGNATDCPAHEAAAAADGKLSSNNRSRARRRKPLAYWVVLPSSYEEMPAGSAAEQGGASPGVDQQEQLPLLGGSPPHELESSGALGRMLSCWDTWFVMPRAPLVQLLPAMTGMQQLVFGYAVLTYSFLDMLHLITAVQHLHSRMTAQHPFMDQGWSIGAAACTISLQLLVMLACRLLVSTLLAFAAVLLLRQLMWGVQTTALLMQLPTLQSVALAMRLHGMLPVPAAAAAVADAATAASAAVTATEAAAQAGSAAAAAGAGTASSSSSGIFGFATAGLRSCAGAADAAAARAAAWLGLDAAGTTAAAEVVRGWLLPYHAQLLSMHYFGEDLVMLTVARLVWETQELLFEQLWRLLGVAMGEAHAFVESAAAAAAMLVTGGSPQAAWGRFQQLWPLQRARRHAHRAADGFGAPRDPRVQAQVFIQAPADMGQAAEALRTLADELEQLGVHPPVGGWGGGGVQRRRVRQLMGQHWPVPLALPFDAETLQAELGQEVPRGFVCPITQDIMQLPALLLSSSVAVPATYDRDAISRWLEDSRRDPKSREVLSPDAQLVPNMDLYRAIEDWAAEKQAALLLSQRAAAAAAAAGAGPAGSGQQAGEAAAAAAALDGTAAGGGRAAGRAGRAAGRARPQRSSSSAGAGAVGSGLLAAARGAAAGLAAVRRVGSQSFGRVGSGLAGTEAAAAAAAVAGGELDDDDGPLLSDEEVDGPARGTAAAAAAAAREGTTGRSVRRFSQQRRQQQQEEENLVGMQQQQQQDVDADDEAGESQGAAAAVRYNLRRRSSTVAGS